VQVFELDSYAYYKRQGEEISAAVNLDGIVANWETVLDVTADPLVRTRHSINLPSLSGHRYGAFIVEVVGGSKACRALLRKGSLNYIDECSPVGHLVRVFDDSGNEVTNSATVTLGDVTHGYTAGHKAIVVPYFDALATEDEPGMEPSTNTASIILTAQPEGASEQIVALSKFVHKERSFTLVAGMYSLSEELIPGRRAKLLIRPRLFVCDAPCDLSLLRDVTLATKVQFSDSAQPALHRETTLSGLSELEEYVHHFDVDAGASSIEFTITADVDTLAIDGKSGTAFVSAREARFSEVRDCLVVDLSAGVLPEIHSYHLKRRSSGFVLLAVGRSGEVPQEACKLKVSFNSQLLDKRRSSAKQKTVVQLQTNSKGEIHLGHLPGVTEVIVDGWVWSTALQTHSASCHRKAVKFTKSNPVMSYCSSANRAHFLAPNDCLHLPHTVAELETDASDAALRRHFTLSLLVNGDPAMDCHDAMTVSGSELSVTLSQPGSYELVRSIDQETWYIKVAERVLQCDSGLLYRRGLVCPRSRLSYLSAQSVVEENSGDLIVNVTDPCEPDGSAVRVHVIGRYFQPNFLGGFSDQMLKPPHIDPSPSQGPPSAFASYLGTKVVSEEYQYIINRKNAAAEGRLFPGNYAERPTLFLRAVNTTKAGSKRRDAKEGGAYGGARHGRALAAQRYTIFGAGDRSADLLDCRASPFLSPTASFTMANVKPEHDSSGKLVVRVPAAALSDALVLEVCVATKDDIVMTSLHLDESSRDVKFMDTFLPESQAYKPGSKLAQHGRVLTLAAGEAVTLTATAEAQSYSTVGDIYQLLDVATAGEILCNEYVKDWASRTAERKLELYSTAPSTELNLFVYHKDRPFFDQYVAPYLANKRDKQFADKWLLCLPLDAYCELASFLQLSISERLLLAIRCPSQRESIVSHVLELSPQQEGAQEQKLLFRMALSGGATATSMIEYRGKQVSRSSNTAGRGKGRARRRAPVQQQQQQQQMFMPQQAMMQSNAYFGGTEQQMLMDDCMEESCFNDDDEDYDDFKEGSNMDKESAGQQVVQKVSVTGKRNKQSSTAAKKRKTGAAGSYKPVGETYQQEEMNYHDGRVDSRKSHGAMSATRFHHDLAKHIRIAAEKGLSEEEIVKGFLSTNVTDMSCSFADSMFALSVLDLPFTSENGPIRYAEGKEQTVKSPAILYVQDVGEAKEPTAELAEEIAEIRQNLVVKQLLYDPARLDNKGKTVKQWPAVFECGKPYTCFVTLINTQATPLPALSLLAQVPAGSVPISADQAYHRLRDVTFGANASESISFQFYFPCPGTFSLFPANVSREGAFVTSAQEGSAMATELTVVQELTQVDKTSWADVSKKGSDEDVLAFLRENNVNDLSLDSISSRLASKQTFLDVTTTLRSKLHFSARVWRYSFLHQDQRSMAEFLASSSVLSRLVGANLQASLLNTTAEHLAAAALPYREYSPLVHPRAHAFDAKRQLEARLTNPRFRADYLAFLKAISFRPAVTCEDLLVATYYLLLQERVGLAIDTFVRCRALGLAESPWKLQADYVEAYLDLYTGHESGYGRAWEISSSYSAYPIVHWRERFGCIQKQVEEHRQLMAADGTGGSEPMDVDDDSSAAVEPVLDIVGVEEAAVTVRARAVTSLTLNYFVMDVEAAFSCEPFAELSSSSSRFSVVRPTHSQVLDIPASGSDSFTVAAPIDAAFQTAQCMVEAVASVGPSDPPLRCLKPHFTAQLSARVHAPKGFVRVYDKRSLRPLHAIYVKAFALFSDGNVRFYKDGYTDLRGYFDYAGLNQNLLADVEEFALLVHSHSHGSVIQRVDPPVPVSTAEDGRQVRANW